MDLMQIINSLPNLAMLLNSYGAFISFFALFITIVIYSKQRGIANKQSTILEDVEGMVEKLNTREAIDIKVKSFFQIYDKNAAEYICIYPFIHNDTPVPDLRMGDSYSVSTIKSLLEIKEHPCRLQGIDRSPNNRTSYEVKNDLNYVLICANLLDIDQPEIPFPKISDFSEQHLDDITDNGSGLPCWFIKGKRTIAKTIDGKVEASEITTVAISVNNHKPFCSELDALYEFGSPIIDVNLNDLAIISRIKKGNQYFILVAGIHNIGSWLAVKYLYKVINGKVKAPKSFLSDDDFIAVIEGDYSLEKKWIGRADLKPGYFWSKKSSSENSAWKCIVDDEEHSKAV